MESQLTLVQCAVEGFDKNLAYVLYDSAEAAAFIIDPSGDFSVIEEEIAAWGLTVTGIILTHSDADHYDALDVCQEQYPEAPLYMHEHALGHVETDLDVHAVEDDDDIRIGGSIVQVWHTPGHTEDSIVIIVPAEANDQGVPLAITGDTLFVEGCGRTDTHGVEDLYTSLQRLATLPDDTVIYPGHDYGAQPQSTIGHEKQRNPYMLAEDVAAFRAQRLGV